MKQGCPRSDANRVSKRHQNSFASLAVVAAGLLATCLSSGCYTRVIRVPGVVDLRSDGGGLETAAPDDVNTRTGVDAILSGEGPRHVNGRIVIEEREAWALGAFPVWNESATEELEVALNRGGVLCDVVIEERVTATDAALYLTKVVPVINLIGLWATPTFTAYLSARQANAPAVEK